MFGEYRSRTVLQSDDLQVVRPVRSDDLGAKFEGRTTWPDGLGRTTWARAERGKGRASEEEGRRRRMSGGGGEMRGGRREREERRQEKK